MKPALPRCVFTNRDGTQCARRVKDGSNPAICHLHSGGQQVDVDDYDLAQRLARNKDPRVQLRALDLLRDIRRERLEQAKEAAERESSVANSRLLPLATPEERATLVDLVGRIKALKATILTRNEPAAVAPEPEPEPTPVESFFAEPEPPPAQPALVEVWRDGKLVPEPRELRPWQNVEDLK